MKVSMKSYPVWLGLITILASTQLGLFTSFVELFRWFIMGIGLWGAYKWGPENQNHWLRNYWAWFLIVFCGISVIWSVDPIYTIMRTVSVGLLYVCSFGAMRHWVNNYGVETLFRQLEKLLGLIILFNMILGLTILPNAWISGLFSGAFSNPNFLATLAGFSMPILLRQFLVQASWFRFTILIATIFSLILSGGRTGTIMALSSCILLLIFYKFRYRKVYTALLSVVGGGVALLLSSKILLFFMKGDVSGNNLLSNRDMGWEIASEKIANHPWLGHGFGTDSGIWIHYGINLDFRMNGIGSSYYGMLYQFGFPITVLFFTLLSYLTLRTLYIGIRTNGICLVYGSILLSGLLAGFSEPWISSAGNAYAWLYWTIAMLAIREHSIARIT